MVNPYNQKITIIPTDYGEIKSLSFQDSLPNNLGSNRLRIPYLEQIIFSEKFIETYVKNLNLFAGVLRKIWNPILIITANILIVHVDLNIILKILSDYKIKLTNKNIDFKNF